MKKIFIFFVLVFSIGKIVGQSQEPPEFWENEKLNEYNRQPMHSTFFAYENKNLALGDSMAASKNFQSLDGLWKFKWVDKPADKPYGFWKTG